MMKRILHYLLLALVLLGVPALCAALGGTDEIWEGVKSFPPRTEDWGFHLERLWNHRCPFSWPWFCGFALFTFVTVFPLARRAIKAARSNPSSTLKPQTSNLKHPTSNLSPLTSHFFPWWGWLGVVVIAVFWTLSWCRIPCLHDIQPHISYMPVWVGYILVVNGLCVKRSGTSPMTRHPIPYLLTFPASSLFWWFFEYLNRYVWNWYYLGVSQMSAGEYAFYATICFASVLPAVTSTAAWLHTFPAFRDEAYDGMARVNLRKPGWIVFLIFGSMLGLTGIVFFPQYSFPLLWISPCMVFLVIQFLLKEPSVMDRTQTGNWALFFRFAIAALICGLCWETWNWHAVAKWVYSVPYVHAFQIWEMPLIGFAGYLPFGVECAAVTAWICPALVENDESLKG